MKRTLHIDPVVTLALVLAAASAAGCSDDRDPDGSSPVIVVGDPSAPGNAGNPTTGAPRTGSNGRNDTGAAVSVGEASRDAYCAGDGPPTTLLVNAQPQRPRRPLQQGPGRRDLPVRAVQLQRRVVHRRLRDRRVRLGAAARISPDRSARAWASTTSWSAPAWSTSDGSLIVAGSGLLPITGGLLRRRRQRETNGDLVTTGAGITFGRDLWVNGNITTIGLASVVGDVYQTPGHTPPFGMAIGGNVYAQDFRSPNLRLRRGRAARHRRDRRDRRRPTATTPRPASRPARVNITAGDARPRVRPLRVSRARTSSARPCCGRTAAPRYSSTAISPITGSFGVDLGSSGELDVFITGNLLLTGAGAVGSRRAAGRAALLRRRLRRHRDHRRQPVRRQPVRAARERVGHRRRRHLRLVLRRLVHGDRHAGHALRRGDRAQRRRRADQLRRRPPDGCRVDTDCGGATRVRCRPLPPAERARLNRSNAAAHCHTTARP